MATRAEQAHDETQRAQAKAKRTKKAAAKKAPRAKGRTHLSKKATVALEAPRPGRPSRKSTRKSANRSKTDSNFNLRESMTKGSPEARARRSKVRASKARGSKS